MKNKEILALYQELNKINVKGVKFNYAVARNIGILKAEVTSLIKSQAPSPEYNAFDTRRVDLCKKYAKRDGEGEPIIENDVFVIDNQAEFDNELKALKESNKEVVEAREAQIDEYNDLLDKEAKVELHKVSIKDVPEDLSTFQLKAIVAIIEE